MYPANFFFQIGKQNVRDTLVKKVITNGRQTFINRNKTAVNGLNTMHDPIDFIKAIV